MFNILSKFLVVLTIIFISGSAFAGETVTATVSQEMFTVNNLWILIATVLVFIMHLGFATLEAGLTLSDF